MQSIQIFNKNVKTSRAVKKTIKKRMPGLHRSGVERSNQIQQNTVMDTLDTIPISELMLVLFMMKSSDIALR